MSGYWKGNLREYRDEGSYWQSARGASEASGGAIGDEADGASGAASGAASGIAPGAASGAGSEAPKAGGGSQPFRTGSVSPQARRAYAAEAMRQKDHVSAGLLAIFLGVFGMHKFYLGCNQAGFLMLAVSIIGGLLTLGLAAGVIWMIAIIEGVIYLTKSQTEFDRLYVVNQRDWF